MSDINGAFFCHVRAFFLLSCSDKRSAFRGSLDCRVKPDNDKKKNKHEHDRGEETNTAMTIFFSLMLDLQYRCFFLFQNRSARKTETAQKFADFHRLLALPLNFGRQNYSLTAGNCQNTACRTVFQPTRLITDRHIKISLQNLETFTVKLKISPGKRIKGANFAGQPHQPVR